MVELGTLPFEGIESLSNINVQNGAGFITNI